MKIAKAVQRLIESFERLPGIGPKTAQRLTYYLLHVPQSELDLFGSAVINLKKETVTCSSCLNIAETDPCSLCSDPDRDQTIICVVEQPLDVLAMEKTGMFKGLYHVLHGAISPLNNIGPDEIFIRQLLDRISQGQVEEVILATNSSMEGEATAMYIQREVINLKPLTSNPPKVTRLAHGLPVGGDLEYADEVTLSRALEGRRIY
ncbi:MAG: Recombination protein RecR [Microgenomates group bacterium GW2011_GWA2_44_7]|nr:MAG: Recombination protein RecR [Microgenomates group bacterium GW2011_GWA2_44_7]